MVNICWISLLRLKVRTVITSYVRIQSMSCYQLILEPQSLHWQPAQIVYTENYSAFNRISYLMQISFVLKAIWNFKCDWRQRGLLDIIVQNRIVYFFFLSKEIFYWLKINYSHSWRNFFETNPKLYVGNELMRIFPHLFEKSFTVKLKWKRSER